jgi:hypothetical protein
MVFIMLRVVFILMCLLVIISPTMAGYTSSVYGQSDSINMHTAVYQSSTDGSYKFGQLSGTMDESGNTHSTLTLGRTAVTRDVTIDASVANAYKSKTSVDTLGMINSHDNSGIYDLKSNIPDTICDAAGNIVAMDTNSTTSRYPSQQNVEGMFGTMSSGNVQYDGTTATVDDTMLNSMKLTADTGKLYKDFEASAIKGFNKSDTSIGYENDIRDHALIQVNSTLGGNDIGIDTNYNGFKSAYDKVLNTTTVNNYESNKTPVDNSTSTQNAENIGNMTFGNATEIGTTTISN